MKRKTKELLIMWIIALVLGVIVIPLIAPKTMEISMVERLCVVLALFVGLHRLYYGKPKSKGNLFNTNVTKLTKDMCDGVSVGERRRRYDEGFYNYKEGEEGYLPPERRIIHPSFLDDK